jgi:hypothetical protein
MCSTRPLCSDYSVRSRDREFLRSLAGTSLNDIPIIGNREFISERSAQGWNGNGRCDQPEPY